MFKRQSVGVCPMTLAISAAALTSCGPVHPRWKNMSGHDIEILYFSGSTIVTTKLATGRIAIPRLFADFEKVERIGIIDAGKTYHLGQGQVSQIHQGCGGGFSCRIEYIVPDHITAVPN